MSDCPAFFEPRPHGRFWVKICGLSKPEDAHLAASHGADAIGVVRHEGSPRYVGLDAAMAVAEAARPALVVAVVVDPSDNEVDMLVTNVGIDILQVHGAVEVSTFDHWRCQYPGLAFVRAVRIPPDGDWPQLVAGGADAVLVDAEVPGCMGGTGTTLRWRPANAPVPIILAGGLTPTNVAEAVIAVRPYGVDVSSGVECAPGEKDPDLIVDFLNAIRGLAGTRSAP